MALIGLLVSAVLLVVPLWMLLPRAGLPAPLALVGIIPFGAIVLLWVMALKRWPGDNLAGRF